jgi:hypothetical protein
MLNQLLNQLFPNRIRHRILSLGLCLVLVLSVLLETGCTLHGRIYNLSTGEVTPVTISYSGSGKGRINAVVASSGETLSGEYLTFAHLPANWGSVYAKVYGTEGTAYTSGASLGASNQYGTAVVTGDKGLIADCEYVTTALTHGAGACVDKNNTLYKLIF